MPKIDDKQPVWKGPEVDGVTFSLLNRFLSCRERFRIMVVEGLKSEEGFNHRIEYGNMWHVCEEAFAGTIQTLEDGTKVETIGSVIPPWQTALNDYGQKLCRKYPSEQEQVEHWYRVCQAQFPIYIDYWKKNAEVVVREPLLQEQVFDVPYKLPSGRVVRLRGKWDAVDLIGKGKDAGIYLQENKTKGQIVPSQIVRQLTFDLQTMMYLVTLVKYTHAHPLRDQARSVGAGDSVPICGVRYNVIRRPLSGGKGTIIRKKATKNHPEETKYEYYKRLASYIEAEPQEYFYRWTVDVTPGDIMNFRRECLDPILEQLCLWWSWVSSKDPAPEEYGGCSPHWRHPYGCVNFIDEGAVTSYDEYLASGSTVGLRQVETLFPELEEG